MVSKWNSTPSPRAALPIVSTIASPPPTGAIRVVEVVRNGVGRNSKRMPCRPIQARVAGASDASVST